MTVTIRIGGHYAQSIGYGAVGDLELQHRYSSTGGGLQVASFKLACPRNYSHPALRQGTLVQFLRGSVSLGWGVMADPDRDAWSFVVDGMYRQAEFFTADGSTNPRAVVVAANTRGMGWNGFGDLPDASISSTSEDASRLNTVADVLNEHCRLNNLRWWLDADNTPRLGTDPTTPTLSLTPGVPAMATAADDYSTRHTVRYVSEVDGSPPEPTGWALASATSGDINHGVRETSEDITSLGFLSPTDATAYAQAVLDASSKRPAFAQSVEVAPFELTTLGGVPAAGWLPLAGQRVKHFGVLTSDGQRAYGKTLEWVIGATTYRPGENKLILSPTELAARTVSQVQASFAAKLKKGFE